MTPNPAVTLKLAFLVILFPVCVFVPGFVAVRRFRLPDELRLSVSVAVSLAFLYVASFALYLVDAGTTASGAIAIAILAGAVVYRRELLAFVGSRPVRTVLLQYAIFVTWLLLLSFLIQSFSGGMWAGDWVEHFERASFFLGGYPVDMQFLGVWSLTARPPLDNLVAALFMRIVGSDFAAYELISVLLGSLQLLGAASLWYALTRGSSPGRGHANLLVLTLLLSLNPSVVQNATYPWTRALTNFLVLQGAALYVLWIRERTPALRRWSFLHLGLALVTHYSTAPYLVGLALVELRFLRTRLVSFKEGVFAALLVTAPMAPWLAFALHHFGVAGTFLSNSTVAWNAPLGMARILTRALGNLGTSLVPHVLREVPPLYAQEYVVGFVRDYAFFIYQVSLPALMGSVGGLAVASLLGAAAVRQLRCGRLETPLLVAAFLATVVLLGIATVADDDPFGVAHICLQPLAVAGLVYLAARWRDAPAWLRVALGLGLLFDTTLGIGLHFWMQHLSLDDLFALDPDHAVVSDTLVNNLMAKVQRGYVFLADLPGRYTAIATLAAVLVVLAIFAAIRASAEVRRADEPC